MIKSIFLLIILFLSNLTIGQINKDITKEINDEFYKLKALKEKIANEEIVKKYSDFDTIFILFEKSKNTKKYQFTDGDKLKDTTIRYTFILNDSSFGFVHKKYLDFDSKVSLDSSLVLKKNQIFLKKNKERILTNKIFEVSNDIETNYFMQILYTIVSTKKIIFIIDKDEFIDNIIVLRQVIIGDPSNNFFIKKI